MKLERLIDILQTVRDMGHGNSTVVVEEMSDLHHESSWEVVRVSGRHQGIVVLTINTKDEG